MRIYLMRHSETEWNRLRRIQGRSDIELNAAGKEIARAAGTGMKDVPIDLCFVSPLKRAVETAELVLAENNAYKELGKPELIPDDRIIEINFGDWEGRQCIDEDSEVPRSEFVDFFRVIDGAPNTPPGAETLRDVIERTSAFMEDICSRPELEDKNILIVTHGCAIKCILYAFSTDADHFVSRPVPKNCAVAVLEKEPEQELRLLEEGRIFV